MKGIRVVVGPVSNERLQVFSKDGEDLTDRLQVKRLRVEAGPNEPTMVHLECYGEVDAEGKAALQLIDDGFRHDSHGRFRVNVVTPPPVNLPVVNVIPNPGAFRTEATTEAMLRALNRNRHVPHGGRSNEFRDSAQSVRI